MINEKDIKILCNILDRINLEDKEESKLEKRLTLIKRQVEIQEEMRDKLCEIQDEINAIMKEDE